MARKSKNPNEAPLRTQKEIQEDYNRTAFEIGTLRSQNHLNNKRVGDLLMKLERLIKEIPAPQPAPATEAAAQPSQAV